MHWVKSNSWNSAEKSNTEAANCKTAVSLVYIPAKGARSKESSSMVHKASIRPQAMPTPEI